MRKNLLFIAVLIFGASFLSSCNDKLKDDMEALEKEIAELKDQQNQTKSILGSDEPITVTTKYLDYMDVNRTYTKRYSLKSDDVNTQYIRKIEDGIYYIYIERFNAVGGDFEDRERVYIEFTYNADTKETYNKYTGHIFRDQYYNYGISYSDDGESSDEIDIVVNSFNLSARTISVTVDATSDSGNNTKFSFSGKLGFFEYGLE